jgi:uncharacterized protein (DUF2252 family)
VIQQHPLRTTSGSVAEQQELGRSLRDETPRSSHAGWTAALDRSDPVALLEEQNESRVPWLVPIRRARMAVSPFAFYRGSARIMASDLASTPKSGLIVQACGDAHLSNFGFYASPERNLVFDVDDFDETLPGPWEWDVKRLAASVVIASQDLGFPAPVAQRATKAAVLGYQEAMAEFAERGHLENWYSNLAIAELVELLPKKKRKSLRRVSAKARGRTSQQALKKFAVKVDGEHLIKNDAPLLLPIRDLEGREDPESLRQAVVASLESYRDSLPNHRQHLLTRYELRDMAMKVVGVGSVGTRCLITLSFGRDSSDPLFLQAKEATTSVLEDYLAPSVYDDPGQRIVEGQHMTQAMSDIFLGWSQRNESGRSYYWRQLRDWNGSVDLDRLGPTELGRYARVCGWTLAHGHARSGDSSAISAYLGSGPAFARAITEFATSYAKQNQRDFEQFKSAIDDGRLLAGDESIL